jgi:hypothetical protein
VPLSKIQTEVLRVIAQHRDPQSYVAGATPLNREMPRFSQDIDLFNDREEQVEAAAETDAAALRGAGYQVSWVRRLSMIFTAAVEKDGDVTRLEWVVDSDYRYFPTVRDDQFGFVLHPVDLALNKMMAAAGRREVRDIVDLPTIHEKILPLGALVWAGVEKFPGFTPEGLIGQIRRNLHHPREDWNRLASTEPIDPDRIVARVRAALDEAEEFVARMPTSKFGALFIKDGEVVQPDPDRLEDYQEHHGHRGGQWPSDPEIMRAMLERYNDSVK